MMYREKRIAVNVSAYNEEKHIGVTLAGIPEFVDLIVVVDDCSRDKTIEIVKKYQEKDDRVKLLQPFKNLGFGGVTVVGYRYIMDQYIHIVANLNGDCQMDVTELQFMINQIIDNGIDMVKGDRLSHWYSSRGGMPFVRRIGGRILSKLTSWVTGYNISDSQHTYHVIRVDALKRLRLDRLYKRFGYPNDFLIECAKQGLTIRDHTVRPVYDNGAGSLLKPWRVWPRILWILAKGWVQIKAARLAKALDTHPDESKNYVY